MDKLRVLWICTLLGTCVIGFSQSKTEIVLTKKIHNFNQIEIKSKNVYSAIFPFTVKGTQPLVIHEVSSSCGCTAVEWLKYPIKPGDKGFVKVVFDPKNQKGVFRRNIFVKSNAKEDVVLLVIKGEVK